MQDVCRRLRLQARSFSRGKSPRGTRYSKAFQVEAIAVARNRQAEGIAVARIARELGLTTQTLTRWLGSAPGPTLRPVRVVAAPPPMAHTEPQLVLLAPGGCRVEGLDMVALVQILRSLG